MATLAINVWKKNYPLISRSVEPVQVLYNNMKMIYFPRYVFNVSNIVTNSICKICPSLTKNASGQYQLTF